MKNTTAVVTGGADGIGLALARAITKRGGRVALLDIRADAAKEAAATLGDETVALGLPCDVAESEAVDQACKAVETAFGSVNQLWVNAGVGVPGDLTTVGKTEIDWVYAVNVEGALNTVRAFIPLVEKAEGLRHVGFTASSNTLGRVPAGPFGTYAASKWALLGIAESVAGAAEAKNIGSTIFCPGLLDTRIWDGGRARPDRFGGAVHMPEEAGAMWRETGMSVDWAAEEAIKGVEENRPYISPVDQHSVDDFEARVSAIRAGFVVHSKPNPSGDS
ncbi:MAG: SDR family oxidoreductase [Pseudomonadota bacterium]